MHPLMGLEARTERRIARQGVQARLPGVVHVQVELVARRPVEIGLEDDGLYTLRARRATDLNVPVRLRGTDQAADRDRIYHRPWEWHAMPPQAPDSDLAQHALPGPRQ